MAGKHKIEATKECTSETNFDAKAETYDRPPSLENVKDPFPEEHDHTADVADMAIVKTVSATKVKETNTLTTSSTGVGNKPDVSKPEAVDTHKISARLPVKATCREPKKWGAKKPKAAHLREELTKLAEDTVTSRCLNRTRLLGVKYKRMECWVTLGSAVPALLAAGSTTVGEAAKDSAKDRQNRKKE